MKETANREAKKDAAENEREVVRSLLADAVEIHKNFKEAMTYTLSNSCHVHGVNPLAWATDALGKLQDG